MEFKKKNFVLSKVYDALCEAHDENIIIMIFMVEISFMIKKQR